MVFRTVDIHDWRQFAEAKIELHPRLTILTGANGAGKTTILNLLSRHFGWHGILVSTPRRRRRGDAGASSYSSGSRLEWFQERALALLDLVRAVESSPPMLLRLSDDFSSELSAALDDLAGPEDADSLDDWSRQSRPSEWDALAPSVPDFADQARLMGALDLVFGPDDLHLLASAIGWRAVARLARAWTDLRVARPDAGPQPVAPNANEVEIGYIAYSNGQRAQLRVPTTVGSTFQVSIHGQQQVRGMHIPSHRPIYSYQPVENIPSTPRSREQLFNLYTEIVRNRFYGQHHPRTANYFIKETLLALAIFGYGNEVVQRDPESLELLEQFQAILRLVLPPSLGFRRIIVKNPEVMLDTATGDVSLDAVSGGISSLIDVAWQIFTYAPPGVPFVVTIDEPENHLHPELQRTVLGNLVAAFPLVQFVCATHNPFIVTSVPDSNVFALRYNTERRVYAQQLTDVDRSGTSNEILRDVLGLDSSSPLWVESRLAEIEESLSGREMNARTLEELREALANAGLERFIPPVLASLIKRSTDA